MAFKRHPEWNDFTFDASPLTPGQLRLGHRKSGRRGITCVVMAFVLTAWSLCGVALFLFFAAFVAGSNVGRRSVGS